MVTHVTMSFRVAQGLATGAPRNVVVADQQRWGWARVSADSGWKSERLAAGARCHGVAMLYPNLFSALYASDGSIWLRVGPRLWDVAQIRTVIQQQVQLRRASYELLFQDGQRASVQLEMPAAVVGHRLIDPTYDEIDSWSDDIMKSLPCVAADGWRSSVEDVSSWVRRVLPIWENGFAHSS
jgi:hypothetical protein